MAALASRPLLFGIPFSLYGHWEESGVDLVGELADHFFHLLFASGYSSVDEGFQGRWIRDNGVKFHGDCIRE